MIEHLDLTTRHLHSTITSTMAGVNSKLEYELIEDKDVLVVKAYELCSSCVSKQRCINCNRYLGLHLYADGEKRCHACVRKSAQFGFGVEKYIYKSLGDTVEEHMMTGGDDQVNVDDFFENSEDEIKSTLCDALKMHLYVYDII